jgi:hypothetical protein
MYRSATYALLLASERLARSLSIGCGAALGLAMLSQPMLIAHAPMATGADATIRAAHPPFSRGLDDRLPRPISHKSCGCEPITRIAAAR